MERVEGSIAAEWKMKNISAKKRLGVMQGRGIDECFAGCGDDASTSCSTCGERFCRDCKMDHDCNSEPKPKKKISG